MDVEARGLFGLDHLDPLRTNHAVDCGIACIPLLTSLSARRDGAALFGSILSLVLRLLMMLLMFRRRRSAPRRRLLPTWATIAIPPLAVGILLMRVTVRGGTHAPGSAGTLFPPCQSAQAADDVRRMWADYRREDAQAPPLVEIRNAADGVVTADSEVCEAEFGFAGDVTERYRFWYGLQEGRMFLRAERIE